MREHGKIFVVSGPSGSGKTTLVNAVLKDARLKKHIARSISFTTRPRRSGEENGKDYFFITEAEFNKLVKQKKILEWTKYLRYYYGTPKEFVQRQLEKGKALIFCLDHKGVVQIRRQFPEYAVTIFILPSSIEELTRRIRGRCSKTEEEEIAQRVRLARQEIGLSKKYAYRLVNDDLDRTVDELKGIIRKELGVNRSER